MNLPLSFVITSGDAANDFFGWATAALSDVNNDGKGEFMVSAIYSNTVYVIYGRNNFPNNLVVSQTNSFKGFRIKGSATDISFGMSISSAGDFNNDGWKDFLISSMSVSTSLSSQNVVYILFGNLSFFSSSSSISADIVMDRLPSYSYLKVIAPKSSFAGFSVSSLGDTNQDGFDDIIIGSIPYQGGYSTQKSYVLYGKQSTFPSNNNNNVLLLSEMKSGEEGFTITGGGFAVAGPGDVNEDGLNDILIVNYQQWQGKENSYLLFFPAVGNITSPPTFLPSSLPSNYPSSSPSSRPSVAVIVDSPTNRPSSSVPSVRLFSGTFPPALSSTLPPTKAPQTIKPSRIPSVKPSTRLPTTSKPITLSPTVAITEKPSFRPTVHPSLVPTRVPSSVTARPSTHRPSRLPSSFPSSHPTESVSTPFTTITITNNGSYEISASSAEEEDQGGRRAGKKEIIVSAPGNVVLYNEGGKNHEKRIYRIIPMENTITIEDFNSDRDILDLIHFPAFQSLSDLPYRSPPITFFLSEKQRIILANLGKEEENEMELTEQNFYFFVASSSSEHSGAGEGPTLKLDSSMIISLVILVVCVAVVTLLVWLPSYFSEKEKEKNKKKDDEIGNIDHFSSSDRIEEGRTAVEEEEVATDNLDDNHEDRSEQEVAVDDDDDDDNDDDDDSESSFLDSDEIDDLFDDDDDDYQSQDGEHEFDYDKEEHNGMNYSKDFNHPFENDEHSDDLPHEQSPTGNEHYFSSGQSYDYNTHDYHNSSNAIDDSVNHQYYYPNWNSNDNNSMIPRQNNIYHDNHFSSSDYNHNNDNTRSNNNNYYCDYQNNGNAHDNNEHDNNICNFTASPFPSSNHHHSSSPFSSFPFPSFSPSPPVQSPSVAHHSFPSSYQQNYAMRKNTNMSAVLDQEEDGEKNKGKEVLREEMP
jgi:hypothetical protein